MDDRGSKTSQDRPTSAPSESYLATFRRFSRNARLYLSYALLSGLGTGIWAVIFNLYMLREGFDLTFIGLFWMIDMLFHGLFAFPAGLIGDKIGRRKTFVIATALNIVARGALLFTLDPTNLLVLSAVAGIGEGFHAVAGEPFMMENSEPKERPHLFSLNSSFGMLSMFVGSLSGGFLPLVWAGTLGVPSIDPGAARWALVTSLPLTFIALVPLALMREKPIELVESFLDLFTLSNVVSHSTIAKLVLCGGLIGIGFGLTTRFFNVFFYEAHQATDDQIGLILAFGSLSGAAAILLSPIITRRWGKVRSILFTQLASIPFLLLMALVPGLSFVIAFFFLRGALYSVSMPLRQQLGMEFIVARERATTAGLTHMAFDLGGGAGALLIGFLVTGADFVPAFGTAAVILIIPAVLYYVFFLKMEQARAAVPTPGMVRTS